MNKYIFIHCFFGKFISLIYLFIYKTRDHNIISTRPPPCRFLLVPPRPSTDSATFGLHRLDRTQPDTAVRQPLQTSRQGPGVLQLVAGHPVHPAACGVRVLPFVYQRRQGQQLPVRAAHPRETRSGKDKGHGGRSLSGATCKCSSFLRLN